MFLYKKATIITQNNQIIFIFAIQNSNFCMLEKQLFESRIGKTNLE